MATPRQRLRLRRGSVGPRLPSITCRACCPSGPGCLARASTSAASAAATSPAPGVCRSGAVRNITPSESGPLARGPCKTAPAVLQVGPMTFRSSESVRVRGGRSIERDGPARASPGPAASQYPSCAELPARPRRLGQYPRLSGRRGVPGRAGDRSLPLHPSQCPGRAGDRSLPPHPSQCPGRAGDRLPPPPPSQYPGSRAVIAPDAARLGACALPSRGELFAIATVRLGSCVIP